MEKIKSRRAGVALGLFSIYRDKNMGIGEISDIRLLVDWCEKTGLSIIQLLPLNDAGFDHRPYDSQSSFALDPVYLSFENLKDCEIEKFKSPLKKLYGTFNKPSLFVNYTIKGAKLHLLWDIFKDESTQRDSAAFESFRKKQSSWLKGYALFKVCKEKYGQSAWWSWPVTFKNAESELTNDEKEIILFHEWLQWQLYEQLTEAKQYAQKKGVYLMGDLPFLVSKDSSDTWIFTEYFKMDFVAGAPPDLFLKTGQRWGMPPYDWKKIEVDGYTYLKSKLKYMESFFHLYRIDHFVGLCRAWIIADSEPEETKGQNGCFDPENEESWKDHGKKILEQMCEGTQMQACAEDLGVVPDCSFELLDEFGIPGMDVQRWMRNWETDCTFKSPDEYRENSIALFATHDMSPFGVWWNSEANAEDKKMFQDWLGVGDEEFPTSELGAIALEKINETKSIYSLQLLQDWLLLSDYEGACDENQQINFPGTMKSENWAWRAPYSLEKMLDLDINDKIKAVLNRTKRI